MMNLKSLILLLVILPATLALSDTTSSTSDFASEKNNHELTSATLSEPEEGMEHELERELKRMSGCEMCARHGRCDYAFHDGPGQFCLYVQDFWEQKPCCCPNNYRCDATAYECLCFHPNNDNSGGRGGDYYDYHDYRADDVAGGSVLGLIIFICICCACCGACSSSSTEHHSSAFRNAGDSTMEGAAEPFIPVAVPAYDSMSDHSDQGGRPPPTAPSAPRAASASATAGTASGGGGGAGSNIASGLGGFVLGEMIGQAIGARNERRHHHHGGGWWGNDRNGGYWGNNGGGFWGNDWGGGRRRGGGGGTTIRGDTGGGGGRRHHHRSHHGHGRRGVGGTTIRGDS